MSSSLFAVFVTFCFLLKLCCLRAALGLELPLANFIQRAKTHVSSFTGQAVSAAVVHPVLAANSCRVSLQQDSHAYCLLPVLKLLCNFHKLLKSNLAMLDDSEDLSVSSLPTLHKLEFSLHF